MSSVINFRGHVKEKYLMMKMIQYFNPFMLSGLFCLKSLDRSISSRRSVWLLLFLPSSIKIHAFIANSVDPDQMLQHLECSI